MKTKICINDTTTFYFENSHTIDEWKREQSDNRANWDFPIEELIDGTIEPNQDVLYWLIDGRLYETNIRV